MQPGQQQPSERVEYLAEALTVALEVAPQLDEDERAQLSQLLPFATPYWLDGLIASGENHATADTQLIAQLLQQVHSHAERERQLRDAFEQERQRANNAAAAVAQAQARSIARPASPRGQPQHQQQRQHAGATGPGSPRGSMHGGITPRSVQPRPPKAQQPARPAAGKAQPRGRAHSPTPADTADHAEEVSNFAGGNGGRTDDDGVPRQAWSDFAGDDEAGVVEAADDDEAAEMERRRAERKEQRFDSISQEIKALNAGLVSEPSTVLEVDTREPCPQCGRKFLPDRLKRHVKVCEDMKRGQEWRGTWKSPSAGKSNPLLMEGRSGLNTSFSR